MAAERIAWVNGEFVEESRARVSILDRGFLYGDSVYDSSRTFDGEPWRMEEHIARLYLSCRYARLDPGMDAAAMNALTRDLLARSRHTVVVFTLPMDYERFAHGYLEGVPALVTAVRRTPPECVEPRAKVGGKMNHIQSEFEARQAGAWAIMLDIHGRLAEGPSYNVFLVRDGAILTSHASNCLVGVNRSYVFELGKALGIPVREADLTHYDLLTADEVFFTGNSLCLLPVRSVDGVDMAAGAPGPVAERLTAAWIEAVGSDWRAKAVAALNRA